MDSLLVRLAPYNLVAAAVFGLLFVADFLALIIYVSRSGKIDPEEGHVVTENRPLTTSDVAILGRTGAPGGRYWGKHKVFLSRSMFVTDTSLVDGTATKAQRRFVHGVILAIILFFLAWFCGGLALLPSQPASGIFVVIFATVSIFLSVRSFRKGRANALRKLQERQESREAHRHKP